jgi:unsaturated rhamnogalacturonyl hydrolase
MMTAIILILSILILICLLVFLIDWIPLAKDWVGRIKIGKIQTKSEWDQRILYQGIRWLNQTPKMKINDQTRLIVVDMIKGNFTRNALQHWQEASLVLGLAEHLKTTKDSYIEEQLTKFVNRKFDSKGQWKVDTQHIDSAILAYALMQLDTFDVNKFKPALDTIWRLIQEHIGSDGTVAYRQSMENYRYVDTIGFICPFLVSYGTHFNKPESIDLAVKQIQQFNRLGMLFDPFIPFHAYDCITQSPLGLVGWGRGLGWYGMGLVDTWSELPETSPYKIELEEIVRKFAKSLKKLQQLNGNWNWMVTRQEATPDSSATASLAWVLFKASQIADLSNDCMDAANKALSYLKTVTRKDGSIDFSQGDTKDIGVYSQLFNVLPFTQGLCIRCTSFNLGEGRETHENHRVYSYIQ